MTKKPPWERVSAIFDQALERPAPQRAVWVAQACGGESDLLKEVEKLLAAHDRAGGVLDQRVEGLASEALGESEHAAAPDEQVGPYRIVEEIGRGGMGVVYRGEDPRLGRSVALKFLPPYLTANEQAKQRLLTEARAVSKLDHPNICTIYDIGQTKDGRLFFAMAYYPGRTLTESIEKGPLPIEEALAIAVQIARGLDHAHEGGVIHRDVKPSNVLLTPRGEVKILDFGLAKQGLAHLTDPGTRVGTVSYMSPEQALGEKVDRRTDLWSLGVTLYEMLSGRKPFSAEYEPAVLYEIIHEDPAPLDPGIPDWLRSSITKLIAKKRDQRFSGAAEFLASLAWEPRLGATTASLSARPASPSAGREQRAPTAGRVSPALSTASPALDIRFCTRPDGVRLAYTTLGQGPPLVLPPGWISHLEQVWKDADRRAFCEALARHHTLILYDKHGTGLSDRNRTEFSLEGEIRDLETVVDHLGMEHLHLLGLSQGGPVAAAYAAHHPQRVSHLILFGAYANGNAITADEFKQSMLSLIRAHWGIGSETLADLFAPGADRSARESFAKLQRVSATAEMACRLLDLVYKIDVSELLPKLQVPTLVMHREHDRAIPFRLGREVAALIPNARFVPLEGRIHFPWLGDAVSVLQVVAEFLGDPAPESEVSPARYETQPTPSVSPAAFLGQRPATATPVESPAASASAAPTHAGPVTGTWSPVTQQKAVGRQKELAELREAFASCAGGRGLVFCVSGEPGIGKTTLVEEFLTDLTATGPPCYVARGRCSERLAGTEAYLPVLDALESLLQNEAREPLTQLMKEVAPTWYIQIAPVRAASDASFAEVWADAKVASQERMKRELNSFLQELARSRPVVIFYDDLHWADVSTVDLLSYIGGHCDSLPLLLLGAYRPSDLLLSKHPFLQVKRELQGRNLCREVAVEFLSERDIASYLNLEFPDHHFPSFLASLIHSRTEGNPLFMADLLRDLQDRSVIDKEGEHWILARTVPEMQRELPESIRGMIERKIERLKEPDRRLLVAAAVQGQEFDSATIATALELDVGDLEERLEHLGRAHRFVRLRDEKELPDGTLTQHFSFVHVLYQNALYATLRSRQKASLSAAVAEALVNAYGDESQEIASDLAYLFEGARDFERASDYFLSAAKQAASVYANQEALVLVQRAVANGEKLRGQPRFSRVLAAANLLGRLHLTLSQIEGAVTDFELAETCAAELGDIEARVNAICAAAQARFILKRVDETREHATRALELAQEAGSEKAAASAELVLGLERLCFGDIEGAEQRFRRSVPLLQKEGPPLQALEAIGFAGLSHAWQLNYGEADQAVNWTLQRARDLGLPYHIIFNLFIRGMALLNRGRLSEGMNDLTEGMRLAEQNNERYWLSRYPNTLGWAYRELQEPETALQFDLDGAKVARENSYGKPEANSHVNLAHGYLELGEPQRAFEHLQEAERIFAEDLWFRWRYYIRLKLEMAQYWLSRGDTKQAGQYASESVELARPRKARKHLAWAHKVLGDVAVAEERFRDGRKQYDAALGVLKHHHCPTVEWRIYLAAAEMAGAYRDVSLAEHYRGRCQRVVQSLADSITDGNLRTQFLKSKAIRSALA